jgi:hypothetical protein
MLRSGLEELFLEFNIWQKSRSSVPLTETPLLQVKAATVMRQLQEKGAEFRALEPTGDIRHILVATLLASLLY